MQFPLTVQFARRRTISLALSRQGEFVVRAPRRVPQNYIRGFVERKQLWMQKTWQRFLESKASEKKFAEGEKFLYLGNEYPLRLNSGKKYKVTLRGEEFFLFLRPAAGNGLIPFQNGRVTNPSPHLAWARKLLHGWYRQQTQTIIADRAEHFSRIIGASFKKIKITSAQTRWGSCNKNGAINFSFRLVMAPPWVLDYVVVHELAHLVYFDHSKKFWRLVLKFCPRGKEARKWLNDNGHKLAL